MIFRRLSLLWLAVLPAPLQGWGMAGHRLVGWVADRHLSPEAREVVHQTLGGASLAEVATWADEIRGNPAYKWTYHLHFADLDPQTCVFRPEHNCPDDQCVVGALKNFTHQLGADHPEALKFVTHFMGDIHQPLHTGWLTDKGGNTIKVRPDGSPHAWNLHALWDDYLVYLAMAKTNPELTLHTYMNFPEIEKVATEWLAQEASEFKEAPCFGPLKMDGCLLEMIQESAGAMCNVAYYHANGTPIDSHDRVTSAYLETNSAVVRRRLLLAGLRLAELLNLNLKYEAPLPDFLLL